MKGEGDNWHVTDFHDNGSISQHAQLCSEFAGSSAMAALPSSKSVLEVGRSQQPQGGA